MERNDFKAHTMDISLAVEPILALLSLYVLFPLFPVKSVL